MSTPSAVAMAPSTHGSVHVKAVGLQNESYHCLTEVIPAGQYAQCHIPNKTERASENSLGKSTDSHSKLFRMPNYFILLPLRFLSKCVLGVFSHKLSAVHPKD